MATAGQLVSEVLRRTRDEQASATSRATVRDLLDRSQVLLVRHYSAIIQQRTFTSTANQLVYDVDASAVLRIVDVYIANVRLSPVRWPSLFAQEGPLWWRRIATTRPRVWAHLGTRHFIMYPASIATFTVTIREVIRPIALSADSVDVELPSEFHPALLDLTEALVLLRRREPTLVSALEQVKAIAEGS